MGLISRVSSRTYRLKKIIFPTQNQRMTEFAKSLLSQNIWLNAYQYQQAEIKLALFHQGDNAQPKPAKVESKSKPTSKPIVENKVSSMAITSSASNSNALLDRITKLEKENENIQKHLMDALKWLEILEKGEKNEVVETKVEVSAAKVVAEKEDEDESDDDDDLFATDSEEE